MTALLSIRHFDRKSVSDDLLTASEVLKHWVLSVLREFGITLSMVYLATTDAGTDVRCMITKLLQLNWEWCVAHMLTNVVKEACGMLPSQASQDNEIRTIIKTTNKIISRIQNSKKALATFDAIVIALFGKKLELKRYLEIRFLGVVNCFERILKLWPCLNDLYQSYFGQNISAS